jgi:DNA-binding CsgD family transcriptional regulator
MRKSTLRQLELFEALGRLGSFSRTAEEMFLTQPTVSMQIKKLTDSVGMPISAMSCLKPAVVYLNIWIILK